MTTHYTDEKNVQIVISLLKQHGIRKVIASPGSTNVTFIRSIQDDPFFEIYSSADERSAAYIACGLAEESGEPVVISCTGASSSRNYLPALTEAYYRKLPIIAITSSRDSSQIGHLIAQVTDRTSAPSDAARTSVTVPYVHDDSDIWDCEIKVNGAILESKRRGGGPVHLNLVTRYSSKYKQVDLSVYRKIERISQNDRYPELPKAKIAIFAGSNSQMTIEQTESIDKFCESNDAVVFCDHTSGYSGKYALHFSIVSTQDQLNLDMFRPDLLIHIGEVSGDYCNLKIGGKVVWRVNPDGEIRDTFKKLKYVFEMPITTFFSHYTKTNVSDDSYLKFCQDALTKIRNIPLDIPLSNIWVASKLSSKIPDNSTIHFAINNSLRSWNFFELKNGVKSMANVGAFGIDGCVSSLIGASLNNPEKLYFLTIGDLAFFFDINVIGNRHVGSNVRILLINNGIGTEFKNYANNAYRFGEDANKFIAAADHYGSSSRSLVKNFATDLGYEYISATTKEEFYSVYEKFVTPHATDKSIIFEVFTNSDDENIALKTLRNLETSINHTIKEGVKNTIKQAIGQKGVGAIKTIFNK